MLVLSMEDQQLTSMDQMDKNKKSILDFIPKEDILDFIDSDKTILEEIPKETILEELD